MKKCLFVTLLLAGMAAGMLHAAPPALRPEQAEKEMGRNAVSVSGGSAMGFGDSYMFGPFGYAEYARNVKGKFWAGGRLNMQVNWLGVTCQPSDMLDGYLLTTVYGIAYWELPVVRERLAFRAGGGIGVGIHTGTQIRGSTVLAPYLLVRMEWALYFTRNFGMTFAPIPVYPVGTSQLEWTPWAPVTKNGGRGGIVKINMAFHIGFFGRF